MIESLREDLYEEIFRSPTEQRTPAEIESTGPLTVRLKQMPRLVIPVAESYGFVPLSPGEKCRPLGGWEELKGRTEFWMARARSEDLTYLHARAEARGGQMLFRPGEGLQVRSVDPAALEYSLGPASNLSSSPLNT
jgi:hypothetical protein